MFGMVADTATNLSLGVKDPGGHLFIDAWIVFIREITASMVAPREASLKTCTYIYNYKKYREEQRHQRINSIIKTSNILYSGKQDSHMIETFNHSVQTVLSLKSARYNMP